MPEDQRHLINTFLLRTYLYHQQNEMMGIVTSFHMLMKKQKKERFSSYRQLFLAKEAMVHKDFLAYFPHVIFA